MCIPHDTKVVEVFIYIAKESKTIHVTLQMISFLQRITRRKLVSILKIKLSSKAV